MMNDKAFVSLREACAITGIEAQTLRKLADSQTLPSYKTPSGQRKFNRAGLDSMCNTAVSNTRLPKDSKQNFIYTRVSSKRQMDDLSRQVEYVKSRRPEYASYIAVSDVGSGINFKRKGLSSILDACLRGTVGEIVVAHRDRLSRFGFDLIELIVSKSGGTITVLDDQRNKSSEQDLSEDLLSIIHIYSCRQMGKRSYKLKHHQDPENQTSSIS
jgi:predicted site-specific integrase-resolvase